MKKLKHTKNYILIVEDQEKNQKILAAVCKKLGYESEIAENGQIALDLITTKSYSIYIVDLMMPVMDGRTFITHLQKKYPDAVILVQTALDSTTTIIDIMKLGVFDYIIKPIDIKLFERTLQKAIEYRNLKNLETNQLKSLRKQIAIVRDVQASMLPNFKDITGFDISFSIMPAEELSGDFLDGYLTPSGEYQIVLCDVSGHGIASSYLGTEIKRVVQIISNQKARPSQILRQVNNTIINDLKNPYYLCTIGLCTINYTTSIITYSSAGHPQSLFYNAATHSCRKVNPEGPMIGIYANGEFSEIEIEMAAGDCLLMYTDGVTDAYSEVTKEMFSEKRLGHAFCEAVNESSTDIVHAILDSVYRFTDYSKQNDDITLVCIKKT